jgi:hypothetical protein
MVSAMPECPHCSSAVEEGAGHLCPVCGEDMLLPPASGAPTPFDAASLAADLNLTPPPLPGPGAGPGSSGRTRTVSTSGPARPVRGGVDDTAATGWGVASPPGWSGHTPTPPPLPSGDAAGPPPLPAEKTARPAHLLLAELEAKRAKEGPRSEDLSRDMPAAEIANAEIEKPAVPKAKRGPSDRAIRMVAGLVTAAGIFAVYWSTQQEPEPVLKVDAALKAEVERRRKAVEALERGHSLVLQGPEQADAAIAAYREALELDPDLASAERGLGISHAAKEQDRKAVEHYRRYLELEPDAEDADEVKAIIAAYEKATR